MAMKWLRAAKPNVHSSKSLTALDEPHALAEAMSHAALIMNDEVEKAEVELSKGTSPFHKLGTATTLFLRATLGFEKEIMEQAALRLADAEEAASEHQRRALRDPSTAHESKIYPRGSEYALCHAETQLMAAVVAVLNESLTESLRGFYKLRKAFTTLSEIIEAENRYVEKYHSGSTSSLSSASVDKSSEAETSGTSSGVLTPVEKTEDEDEFKDAVESASGQPTPMEYRGKLQYPDVDRLDLEDKPQTLEKDTAGNGFGTANGAAGDGPPPYGTSSSKQQPDAEVDAFDFRAITDDPIDHFIHSGVAMCFGLLQLLLSMIPPAFGKILSIFSFRGDREAGMRLLWRATAFKNNINGAMAGLVLLPFHNAAIALCDIHRKESYPKERLHGLLKEMRTLYPRSIMWVLEESRMHGVERNLEEAVDILTRDAKTSSLKQMEALRVFETSMALMFLHRYEECAAAFQKCVHLNNWSHGLYYYIAGSCFVELHRQSQHTDPKLADTYRDKAKHLLGQVAGNTGKKKFMARQLPLDVYINRKLVKWQHRAKTRDCDLIDAIGISPLEEMIYFWNGYKRMSPAHLQESMARLAWSHDQPTWPGEAPDEKAICAVLHATVLRNLGKTEEAKTMLGEHVFCYEPHQITASDQADNWPLPVAHYELSVCHWNEAGGQDGDAAKLKLCSDELAKVERWGSFELDARVGLKLTTARQTLTQTGIN
ncbi:hypothetical protein CBER1_00748 [Cercospora berteroae]|uniref:Inclusion body clearance protein IML2 n=1 Tax=Cercospora berteroae TaxID=357750 RepID=A0A2S6C9D4_9PEZI|nr:hypothetical protein CBER1_00748 [Cercospora berteroae]